MPTVTRSVARGALGGAIALLLVLLAAPTAFAQGVGTLTGQVVSQDTGEPVIGANIRLEGTSLAAATDIDGVFTFSVPAGSYTAVISAISYSTVRQPITIQSGATFTLDVQMSEDALLLDDVVVTGYGARERRNLATSISTISGADLQDVPATTVDGALQGRAAGVTVLRSSGTPGGGVSVRVRGSTSISGSNQPLFIIDGVPVSSGSGSAIGVGNQGLNGLASIDVTDIESIEVLKDAAATAIYGTRAANGVVLVTTKRGRNGQTRVNLETSVGTSAFNTEYETLTASEYFEILGDGVAESFGEGLRNFFGSPDDPDNVDTNFFDELSQTGVVQNYRASINGGDERTRFLVSGSFLDEEGALIRSAFQRYNGRVNVDHTPNERTIIQGNASYNRAIFDRVENDNNIFGLITNALVSAPARPLRDSTGNFTSADFFAFGNPLAEAQVFNQAVDTKFLGNVTASYEFAPGLRARLNAGLDRSDLKEDQFAQSFTTQGSPAGNGLSSVTILQTYLAEATLNYRRLFNGVHDFSTFVGTSVQQDDFERTFASASVFATDTSIRPNSGAIPDGGGTGSENSLLSFFGNVDYSFDNRYLLAFNARVDGSSRFGDDNRYAFFPGLALGWNVHEEPFLSGLSAVDLFKLRASAGRTGQQEIGNFSSLGLFGFGGTYDGRAGIAPSQLANPDLKWETTTQIAGGVDLGFLDGRVSTTVDVYLKDTDDLLLFRQLENSSGFGGITENIGSIRNTGVEFGLTTVNVRTPAFRWQTTVNLSRNVNEVLALNNDEPIDSGFGSRIAVGQPLGAFYGFQSQGLFTSADQLCTDRTGATCAPGTAFQNAGTRVGDVRFADIGRPCTAADNCAPGQTSVAEPDGIVNSADRTFIGDPNPDLFGGITNAFSFQGLELSAFLQFSLGNDVFNASRQFTDNVGGTFGTSARLRDRARIDADGNLINPDATLPRATFSNRNDNARDSDRFVEDGSYMRLKTLTLGYTVPTRFLQQVGGRSLRLYLVGENLFTITDYTGLDPEVSTFDRANASFGTDFFTFPQTRRFTVGVQLGL